MEKEVVFTFLLAAAAAAATTTNRLHYCLVTRHCSLAPCHYMYLINVVNGAELQPATLPDVSSISRNF